MGEENNFDTDKSMEKPSPLDVEGRLTHLDDDGKPRRTGKH